MSEKNPNHDCAHAAEIVSYLYEEIGEREKAGFETHLANCRNCADELADFSFARFAVKDWREAQFDHLETPAFEIPFETKQSAETVLTNSESLLERLRRIFSLTPIWATSAASLAIIVGLVLTITNLFQPDLVADKNTVYPVNNSVSPSVKTLKEAQTAPSIEPKTAVSVTQSPLQIKNNEPEKRVIVSQNRAPQNRRGSVEMTAGKSSKIKETRETSENIASSGSKNPSSSMRRNSAQAVRLAPTLNGFDEEEDNTLRLAELFEEIDADK